MSRPCKPPRKRNDGETKYSAMPRANRPRPLAERYWEKVNKTPGFGPEEKCWKWLGYLDQDDYGVIRVGGHVRKAHQVAYFLEHDIWPDTKNGELIRHSCHNPACVNPAHLRLGTNADNSRDMVEAGRQAFQHGTKNGQAKLNVRHVQAIRTAYRFGHRVEDIAIQLDTSDTNVRGIIIGTRWPSVPGGLGPLPAWKLWRDRTLYKGVYREVSQAEAEDIAQTIAAEA